MKRGSILAALVAILLVAAALRLHYLGEQSFWNDEGNSARLSERSLKLIVEGTASDVHPPLYYIFLRGWRELAGDSEFALRSFSAFLGVGVVAVSYRLGRQLLGQRRSVAVVVGTFLAAVNPALIYYSQETRMYELLAFLAVVSTWLLIRLLQENRWRTGIAIAYIGVALAGLYTHYSFPAVLVTHNLIFLTWFLRRHRSKIIVSADEPGAEEVLAKPSGREDSINERPDRRPMWVDGRNWLLIMAALILLYAPWLPIFLRQTGGRPVVRPPLALFFSEGLRWSSFGSTFNPDMILLPLLAYGALLLIGLLAGRKLDRRGLPYSQTMLFLITVPALMMWLMGATRPAYYKFLLVIVPPLCLLAGAGWVWGWYGRGMNISVLPRRITFSLMGILVLWGTAESLNNMYYDSNYARADYRSIADRIAADDETEAAVILNAANQWEVFTYYHKEGAPVFPLPQGYPDPATIDAELAGITSQIRRIYVVFWGESERDPQRLVERWLDAHAYKAHEEWVGDVRFVTYSAASPETDVIDSPAAAHFGDHIQLLGYALNDRQVIPGDILQLTLFWQAEQLLADRYKVFLHLLDTEGQIVAQRDSEPGGGLVLTTTWSPDERVLDNHGLIIPRELPAGQYELIMGLYDINDPAARLPVLTGGEAMDTFTIGQIVVADN